MEYILGIITGILLSAFLVAIDLIFRKKYPRGIMETTQKSAAKKGSIIEAPNEEIEGWITSLEKES